MNPTSTEANRPKEPVKPPVREWTMVPAGETPVREVAYAIGRTVIEAGCAISGGRCRPRLMPPLDQLRRP